MNKNKKFLTSKFARYIFKIYGHISTSLRDKCLNMEFFSGSYFPAFGLNIWSISLYSVRMREYTDQRKLRIWTLFTQCWVLMSVLFSPTSFRLTEKNILLTTSFQDWLKIGNYHLTKKQICFSCTHRPVKYLRLYTAWSAYSKNACIGFFNWQTYPFFYSCLK